MMNYANLHLHSTHSDGGLRPSHLVRVAKCLGYKGLALTDHDVMSGVPELIAEAKAEGMRAITGMELTCYLNDINFHIVALDFDIYCPGMVDFVDKLCHMRNEHTKKQFDLAIERGILVDISWDEVLSYNPGCKWFCNEQVYRAIEMKGVMASNDRRKTYEPAFKNGKAAAIKLEQPDAKETLDQIRRAGGVSVLAHPQDQLQYVPLLVEMGLKGIEVSHPDIDEKSSVDAAKLAKEYGLYTSGGTDHTGALGVCAGGYCVPALHGVSEEEFNAIIERRLLTREGRK